MFKHLQLQRPIVFLDLETTGIDPWRDRIVEIGLARFAPQGRIRTRTIRLNPECHIPDAAFAIHGYADEHVKDCPTFAQSARDILAFIGDADLAGFNIAQFDLPMLVAEFRRAGREFSLDGRHIVDAMALYHRQHPRDLVAAARTYLPGERRPAHQALADAVASAKILDAMLAQHEQLPRGIAALDRMSIDVDIEGWLRRDNDAVVFARGRHRGRTLHDVAVADASYLAWLRERVMPDLRRMIDTTTGRLAAAS